MRDQESNFKGDENPLPSTKWSLPKWGRKDINPVGAIIMLAGGILGQLPALGLQVPRIRQGLTAIEDGDTAVLGFLVAILGAVIFNQRIAILLLAFAIATYVLVFFVL